jgi:hypothetical protein
MKYIIKVTDKATGEVIQTMESDNERKAYAAYEGLLHQINHEDFKATFEGVE